jgi:hypothetical protein
MLIAPASPGTPGFPASPSDPASNEGPGGQYGCREAKAFSGFGFAVPSMRLSSPRLTKV